MKTHLYYAMGVLLISTIYAEMTISDLDEFRNYVKQLKRDLKALNSTFFEIKDLSNIEEFVSKVENFIKNETDFEDEYIVLKRIETFTPDVFKYTKQMQEFTTKMKLTLENNTSIDCLNLIRTKNYKNAAKMFLLISDMQKVHWILNETYQGNKSNFYLIKNTIYEIPSISLSLEILKFLNILTYNLTDIELKLNLIKTIKENVYDQVSVFPDTLSNSIILMENIKNQIKPLIVEKLLNFLTKKIIDEETKRSTQIIIDEMKDYKYFKELSEEVIRNWTTYDLYTITNKFEEKIPQVLILNSLFEKIYNEGLTMKTVPEIITILHVMNQSYITTPQMFKKFLVIPDINFAIGKQLKFAFLNRFYGNSEFDGFLKNICTTDSSMFLNIMEMVTKQIYGKIDTVRMLEMINKTSSCAKILGYLAVYHKMGNKGELIYEKLSHEIYMFNFYLRKILDDPNITEVGDKLYHQLRTVFSGLSNTVFIRSINMTFQQYKVYINMTAGDGIDVIEQMESKVVERKDIDHLVRFIGQFANRTDKMYYVIIDFHKHITDKENNSIYLFHVTEQYKSFLFSGKYSELHIEWKFHVDSQLHTISHSIINIVFCEKVFLKNIRRGGEYVIIKDDSVFTSTKGNQSLYSSFRFEFTGYRSEYRIKSTEYDKYLVFDEENVFLAKNGTFDNDFGVWKLIPSGNKVFIKSKFHNEYLYAGGKKDTKTRNVLVNRKAGEPFGAVWSVESAFSYKREGKLCTDFLPFS